MKNRDRLCVKFVLGEKTSCSMVESELKMFESVVSKMACGCFYKSDSAGKS